MPHIFVSAEHGAYTPDGKIATTAEDAARINAETDAAELAAWAERPERFEPAYFHFPTEQTDTSTGRTPRTYTRRFAPLLGDRRTDPRQWASVTTWNGSLLGYIVDARVYAHNFGGRMVSLTVQGTNGARYYGRASWDGGTVVRLRRVK